MPTSRHVAAILAALLTATSIVSAQEGTAMATQRANALPLTPFYDVQGADLSRPGALVRSEPGAGYNLPGGVTATRIAYASRNVSGEPVLATGVVLVPPGTPPAGGWPVIAWAHGTSGVARVCAPSLMKDLYYGWDGLFIYPLMGYAVVATDYAGLGSPGVHQYMWGRAQGNDVAYSIPAARAAVPSLGTKWVAIGHSQGGYAVLRVQSMDEKARAGFLGSIPIASGAEIADVWALSDARMRSVGSSMLMMALSIKTVNRDFDVAKMIGPAARERLPAIEKQVCLDAADEVMRGVTRENGRVEGWMAVPEVAGFARDNRIFNERYEHPILLLLSSGDEYIAPALQEQIPRDLCKFAARATFKVLAGVNHSGTINASLREQFAWMADRFAGRPAPPGCAAMN